MSGTRTRAPIVDDVAARQLAAAVVRGSYEDLREMAGRLEWVEGRTDSQLISYMVESFKQVKRKHWPRLITRDMTSALWFFTSPDSTWGLMRGVLDISLEVPRVLDIVDRVEELREPQERRWRMIQERAKKRRAKWKSD